MQLIRDSDLSSNESDSSDSSSITEEQNDWIQTEVEKTAILHDYLVLCIDNVEVGKLTTFFISRRLGSLQNISRLIIRN